MPCEGRATIHLFYTRFLVLSNSRFIPHGDRLFERNFVQALVRLEIFISAQDNTAVHKIGTSFHATVVGLHHAPFNNEIIHVHVPGHATFAPVYYTVAERMCVY